MEISVDKIKELRERTGAGIMDCKKALQATRGEIEKAIDELRKQGVARAKEKMGRLAREGIIDAYIHPGERLGVLVEVNCETDFVARTDEFRRFCRDIAMQVAATNPLCVEREQLDTEIGDRERSIYRTQALNLGKPEKVVDRIVEGKMEKFYSEVCLLEQPFIKDPDKTVGDLLKEKIAELGENIAIKRFSRFRLGD